MTEVDKNLVLTKFKAAFLKQNADCHKFLSTVLATDYNRVLIFKEPVEGRILPDHVIRTEKVANEGSCRVRCFLEPNCVSINVGATDDQGQRTCELNNFTDESPSQSGLKEKPGHIHYSAEVSNIFADYHLCLSVLDVIHETGNRLFWIQLRLMVIYGRKTFLVSSHFT